MQFSSTRPMTANALSLTIVDRRGHERLHRGHFKRERRQPRGSASLPVGSLRAVDGSGVFAEYESVLARSDPFLRSPISDRERDALLAALISRCTWVRVYYLWRPNLPDEADNHLVELAVAGNAAAIVTQHAGFRTHRDALPGVAHRDASSVDCRAPAMSTLTIRLPDDTHARMKALARQRAVSVNKLMEELCTIAVTQHDAETRFRALSARGSIDEGLRVLDKLDHALGGGE